MFSPFARAIESTRVASGRAYPRSAARSSEEHDSMSQMRIEDSYPLSPLQAGMLFHTLYAPRAGVDVEQMVCSFREPLDAARLRAAWEQVVAARPVLRTGFRWEGLDEPLQEVHAAVDVPWIDEDLRALAPDAQEARLRAFLDADRVQGFDPARAPLLRLALFRTGDEAYRFVFTFHHMILDGGSFPLVVNDVFACYEALGEGRAPSLPERRPFGDFIAWLRAHDVAPSEAFWREHLRGLTAPTPLLGASGEARSVEEIAYGERAFRLPEGPTAALAAFGARHRVTMNTLLQAAWSILLSRYAGEESVVFGVTRAGRRSALGGQGTDAMVGVLMNTLPVRVDVRPDLALLPWLAQLTASGRALREHEHTPLVRVHEWSEMPAGVPLFESLFVYGEKSLDASLKQQGGAWERRDFKMVRKTNFPLVIIAYGERELDVEIEYDRRRFSEATMDALVGHLTTLLVALAEDPDRQVGDLAMLTADERRRLLVDWNGAAADYPRDLCVPDLFEAQADRTPDAIAVTFGGESLTYAELDRRANQLASFLRARGVGPDVPVALCLSRGIPLSLSILATFKAGGAYLSLDPEYPADRLAFMMADARPPVLLTEARLAGVVPAGGATVLRLDVEWDRVASEPAARPARPDLGPDHLAYLIYTSGSTGKPKGVAMTQRPLVNLVHWQRAVSPGAFRTLQFASSSFDVCFQEHFCTWATGGALVLVGEEARRDAEQLWQRIAEASVERIFVPPVALYQLAEALASIGATPRSLREVITAGEALQIGPRVVELFEKTGAVLRNQYGPSETHVVTEHVLEGPPSAWPALPPIGKPIHNVRAYVLDERRRPVPAGVRGELYFGGVQVARGYLGREDLTRERFLDDPLAGEPGARMYKTGDLARWLPDGSLEFLGRADFQVKIRGFRVELGEIEVVLAAHPAIKDAVVVAREDAPGQRRLVAYLTPGAGAPSTSELRSFLKDRLPDYMIPAAFVVLDALPLTASGKVNRLALPAPEEGALGERAHASPRGPVEEALAGIFAEVLRIPVERVGAHDGFFELGGHSLLAAQAISRVRAALGVELPVRAIFDSPTVAELAARVEAAQSGAAEAPPPLGRTAGSPVLSFAQQRLWALDQIEPGDPAYIVFRAVRLRGALDRSALERALALIVERHEVLRTTIASAGGEPVITVQPAAPFPVPLRSLAAEPDREAALARELAAEARRTFDLAAGPMIRARLFALAADEHVLAIAMHHIVSDGWTLGVLDDELGAAYAAFAEGRAPDLPELPIQYADYARWQRRWLSGAVLDRELAHWRAALAGAPTALDLPADRRRPPVESHRGARVSIALPAALTRALKDLSRREGVTLYMTLLAAFDVLLHRYTGQDDLLVGTPIANRTQAATERLCGFFVNTLVLRARVAPEQPFRALLAGVREAALAAYAHQDLPFERLVQDLAPERDRSRSPIFQVMFALQNASSDTFHLPGLAAAPVRAEILTSKFDLTLLLSDRSDAVAGFFEYASDLFDAATIERMAEHYVTLLEGAVAAPEAKVSALPLLPEAERRRVLVDNNATAHAYPTDLLVHEVFAAQAARTPDAIALRFERRDVTYRELDARANQLAHALRKRGVGPDALVGVFCERSVEMVVALYGILKAGGAYVPLDPDYPRDRLAFMLDDAKPKVILTQERLASLLPDHGAALIRLDTDWSTIASELTTSPARDGLTANHLAYVIYTSGSTGRPKGAMNEHRGILNRLFWMQRAYGLTSNDHVLQKTPYSFDVSVWEFFWPLMFGARLVIAKPDGHRDPSYLAQLIRDEQITTLHFVPSMLAAFLDEPTVDQCRSLRRVLCSGEALPPALAERFFARLSPTELHNLYGPTECAVDVTAWACQPGAAVVPIGRPIDNTRIYILDEHLAPVPVGVPGELYIAGVQVGRGYLDRAELTAERFLRDPFAEDAGARMYKSGDVARWLPDGSVEYLGRADFQVKIRGFRIELGEIEAALLAHPGVREAVVVAREDRPGQKRLVAYLACADGEAPTAEALRAALKEHLPEYMVPAAFVLLPALPLTASGKVNRRALPAPEEGQRAEAAAEYAPPTTRAEEELARIWAAVLRLPRVGIHDNFFEIGGDSILGIQIVARAQQAGLSLTPRQMFEHQTIAELAAVAGSTTAVAAEQGAVVGSAPLGPIAAWWMEGAPRDEGHFNQAFLVESAEALDPKVLGEALRAIIDHHDALRVRLVRGPAGVTQRFAEPGDPVPLAHVRLAHLPEAEQRAALEKAAAEAQASLDLERGPALRVVLFDLGEGRPQRLLWVIHHLAVDGVSWRILFDDLWSTYDRLQRGEALALPPKTTSFKRWIELSAAEARSAARAAEVAHWTAEARARAGRLPVDHATGENTEASTKRITVELSADETAALLREVPEAYGTQINDVLLAALADAVSAWTGSPDVLVDLEGHGREDVFAGVDVTRTVGWFTALFPVALRHDASAGPGERLKAIKEQLRGIPGRGLGHGLLRYLGPAEIQARLAAMPRAEIIFNYLGQVDQVLPEGSPFRLAGESAGPLQSPRALRPHLVEVIGRVTSGKLTVRFTYSEHRHRAATIEALAQGFAASLRALVIHAASMDAGGYTPSDLRRVRLAQPVIDALAAQAAADGDAPRNKNIEDVYPLSPLQQGLLFHTMMSARRDTYVVQLEWSLVGPLDAAALARAWQAVVDRHAILRSAVAWEKLDAPLQVVRRAARVPFEQLDLRGLPEAEQAARIARHLEEDRRRGFNVTRAPLLRVTLLRLRDDEHRHLWTMHHLALDGWSLPLIAREVFAHYEAFVADRELRLSRPRAYGDYIDWLGTQDRSRAEAFWRSQLHDVTAPTPLGVDRPAAGGEERFGEVRRALSEDDSAALTAFARRHRLTVSTLVQGAWALLLSRYSGERDVVFGATVSGRSAPLAGIDSMVGLFINTLPVRVSVPAGDTALAWLGALQQRQAELRDFEHTPLLEAQAQSAVPRGTPLFESLVVFENYPMDDALARGHAGVAVTAARAFETPAYPLTVIAVLRGALQLRVGYDERRFDAATVARLAEHLENLLTALVRAPEAPLAALSPLSEAERRRVLVDNNATAHAHPTGLLIHEVFAAQAARTPDAIALRFEGRDVTYRELDARANQLAHALRKRGVGPDALVGVFCERSVEMVVALYGVLKAGGAYVPLDPDYPKDRLAFMLEDAKPKVILTQDRLASILPDHGAALIRLDTDWSTIASEPTTSPARDGLTSNHLAYVIYTSGSTGRPKGAMNEHRGILNRLFWMQRAYGLTSNDHVLQKTPYSFDVSVWEFFWPLMFGARLVVARPDGHRDPSYLAQLIRDEAVTTLHFVPSMLAAFLDEPTVDQCRSLRRVLCSGEALPPALAERFFARLSPTELHNLYGPTECAVDVTAWACQPGAAIVPIGRPIDNTRIYILDEHLAPVPVGVPGELYIAGVQVGRGYLDRAELTAERFLRDPFAGDDGARMYKSGDVARWLPDGSIEYLGRADFQVKIRGFRIELGEIEAALLAHPGVREAVVSAREDTPGQKRLVAYLVCAEGEAPAASDLRNALKERLPEYMVPAAFVLLDRLPLTASGKVNRRALPAPDADQADAGAEYAAPETPAEREISRIWAAVLRLPRVGVHDNFFEVGGDSILSIQIVARAQQVGLSITPRQIFEHPTIAELAKAAGSTRRAPVDQGPVVGPVPLGPIARWWLSGTPAVNRFNQSFLLEHDAPLDEGKLREALRAIVDHHDALRVRLARGPNGWEQSFAPPGGEVPLRRVDLSGLPEAAQRDTLAAAADDAQGSLDLEHGPALRIVSFDLGAGRPGRLLLVIHHLAVDGVSWRILLDDLWSTYDRLQRGEAPALPPKTTSFKRWGELSEERARSEDLLREEAYWLAPARERGSIVPLDIADGDNTYASAREVTVSLSAEETAALLREAPQAYGTQINDVLLAALAEAVSAWTGSPDVVVDLEGHGREEIFDDVDVTRTVGWFTALFPVALHVSAGAGPGERLRSIKEQLRAVPSRGVNYGLLRWLRRDGVGERFARQMPASILFNYLGQIDQILPEGSPFRLAPEPTGLGVSLDAGRPHLLDVTGRVVGGQLVVRWTYSEACHLPQTIEAVAGRFLASLRALVAHAASTPAGAYTPSDFRRVRLSQSVIDRLAALAAEDGEAPRGKNVEDIHRLSPMQEGLLFHTMLAARREEYVIQLRWSLRGALDAPAFARAWQAVVDRHAILRTGIVAEGLDAPLAVVRRAARLPFEQIDLSGLPEGEQATRVEAYASGERARGFDVAHAPLLRVGLIRLGEDAYALLLTMHHLIVDGWSLPILVREVLTAYEAQSLGRELRLPAPRPYADFAAWVGAQDRGRAEAYWRAQLHDVIAPTPLGVDHPASEGPEAAGDVRLALSDEESAALNACARRHRLTVSTLVQAAWALLLSRYSRERDVVFGVTVSGRSAPISGIDTMVGLFINTLPIRVSVSPDEDAAAFVGALQDRQAELRDFEHTPLVDAQAVSGVPRGTPLFESLVVFENYPLDEAVVRGNGSISLSGLRAVESLAYPLTVVASFRRQLSLRIGYDARRFDEAAVARLAGHLRNLLLGLARAEGRLAEIPMLGGDELSAVIDAGRAVAAFPVRDTVHARFEAQVDRTPDARAATFDGRSITYRELDERANRLAHLLRGLGVGPGKLVGLCVERSLEMLVGIVGILKAGGAYLPLDPDYPKDRLAFMMADAAAPVLLTQSALADTIPAGSAKVVRLDGDEALLAAQPSHRPAPAATIDDLAYVIYTSGSTGKPKGTMVTHANVVRLFDATFDWYRFDASDVWTMFHSYAFDFSVWEIWGALFYGGRVVIVPYWVSRSPDVFHALLGQEGVTVLNQTPSAFRQLVRADEEATPEARAALRLRYVIFGGEALEIGDLRPWWDRHGDERPQLVNMYGITETTVHVTYRPVSRADLARPRSSVIGRPIPDLALYLLDPARQPVPVGVVGEIYVGGAGVARGYLDRPELTAERFLADPWSTNGRLYKSGDLARRLPNGDVEYIGRADFQVKIRGFRVELGEIEAAVGQHPAVREVVVLAREDVPGDKRLCAYIVANGAPPDTNELRAQLKQRLPDHMVPAAFVLLDALPLTENGKVDRRALPAPAAPAAEEAAFVAPRGPIEEAIASVFADVLKVPRVGAHDGFFELGGHSLLATQVVTRLRGALSVALPLRALFEAPTPAELAKLVGEELGAGRAEAIPPIVRVPREGEIAPSFGQERLWVLYQLAPEDTSYVVSIVWRLEGALDVDALRRALREVCRRHEVLRTTLASVDGRPVQIIHEEIDLPMPVTSWASLPPEEREEAIVAEARGETQKPFDLSAGPLVRARLVELGAEDHVLFLGLHHVVFDAWSQGLLHRELAALYGAFREGRPSPLAALPFQYADYAAWQRRLLGGEVLDRQLAYWKEQLEGAPASLDVPADRPRPPVRSSRGALLRFSLGTELTEALKALARREGVTLYMTLLAAFDVLLHRYTGQDDIVVGSPIAGRTLAETEGLIGFFLNTLVIRARLSGVGSFSELLRRVREVSLGAFAHQDMPFERLVQELHVEPDPSRSPVFQVIFNLQNAPMDALSLPGLTVTQVGAGSTTVKVDLTLIMNERDGNLRGFLEYSTDLFDLATVERLVGHFRVLLEGIVADAARPLAALPLLPAEERRRLLVAWNDTAASFPAGETIASMFEATAARTPDAIALVAGEAKLTFRELSARANRLGRHLRSLGVQRDSVVGLCMDRSAELVVGLLGILAAGGAYVPLDPAYPPARLAQILTDAGASVVVTRDSLAHAVPQNGVRRVRLDGDSAAIDAESGAPLDGGARSEDLCYVLFTSGSTGKPKGVAIEHRQLVNYVRGVATRLDLPEGASYAHVSTFAADLGNTVLFPPLCLGGTLHVIGDDLTRDPDGLARYMRHHAVDCLKIVPSHLVALLSGAHPEDVLPRKLLVLGGEASSWDLVERIERLSPATRIMNHYGPTETTVGVLTFPVRREQRTPTAIVPLGRPLPNSRIYLLDASLEPVPTGVPGEVYIGGAGVARGYLGRPDLTAERFVRDPFVADPSARMYRTGDRARYLPDGALVFLGRIDHQVKIRGFRIELGEIEAAINAHAGVRESVVLVHEDASGDRRLVGYMVPRPAEGPTIAELKAWLGERLPDYMVPSEVHVLDALPLTPNGKIDRQALAALVVEKAEDVYEAPRTPAEEVLAGIWCDVFERDRIGIHERFADLGGHSLLAIQIIARAREAFQADVPLRAIFEAPTIAGLAERVEAALREGEGPEAPPVVPVPRDAPLPLSFSQERLWFLDQLEPDSAAYNVPTGLRLGGRLDVPALEHALRALAQRHEVLRTTFTTVGGKPVQVVHDEVQIKLAVDDLCGLPADTRETVARREAEVEAQRPFDLAKGPLVRARLLRLAPEDHVLLLTMHHIVSDAWTRGILSHEIAALYTSFHTGKPHGLRALPVQYADYAAWQRGWLSGPVLEGLLGYWKRQLTGAPAAIELPTDRPRPPVQSGRGARRSLDLPLSLARSIAELARRENVTLFMATLAGFYVLLHRYTSQDDISIGTPAANRTRSETEGLLGFFVNTLVLRAQLSGDLTFRDLLARVREVCLAGYAHQEMPFERLVNELAPDRDLSRTPLFQVMFVYQNEPVEALTLPGLELRSFSAYSGTAKFDLLLAMTQGPKALHLLAEYAADLFDGATIERMLGHVRVLFEGIVADPDKPLRDLPILPEAERHQLLAEWNVTTADYPAHLTVHGWFERQADRTPDAPAATFDGKTLTYRELEARSNQVAHHLKKRGVGPEVLVGLCVERSMDMLVGLLGILKAGGAYVPLDPEYPKDRLAFMVEDAKVPVVLTQSHVASVLPDHGAARVLLDADWPEIAKEPESRPPSAATPENLAYVIYTSGSTGKPKGAMVEHYNVVRLFEATDTWYRFGASDVWTMFHSYAFDFSVWEIWGALFYGGRVVIVPYWVSRNPEAFHELCGREGVTVLNQTPSAFRQFVRVDEEATPEARSKLALRYVIFGGEALDLGDLRPWWERRGDKHPKLVNMYGITETTVHVTYRPVGIPDLDRPWSSVIGRAIPDLQVHILDAARHPVPIGVPGEMYVGGAGVARGYLNRPDLTADRFLANPFREGDAKLYKTGDLARYLASGDIEYLGRIDHQVKIRGFRIELGEIEAVLDTHPAVREAVVLARSDGPGEKRLVAYLVCREGEAPTVTDLRAFVKQKLPDMMVPAAFVLLDALPLTSNGKVDRRALPAPEEGERAATGAAYAAPTSHAEEELCRIWAAVLRLEKVGIHDNFFELGGDSILSIQIVARARDAGLHLSPKQIFQHQTVAELAAVAGTSATVEAEQGPVTGPVPITPVQAWFLAQDVVEPHHHNQAMFLEVREPLDLGALTAAVAALVEHHDMLRVRVTREGGEHRQLIAPPGGPAPVTRVDVSHLAGAEQTAAIEREAAAAQASLDLVEGPAVRAVAFDLGPGASSRLLLVVHHMAVDGVSWRILLEDLWSTYERARRGEAPALPPKTTSFKRWAEKLAAYARSEAVRDEEPYWLAEARTGTGHLPVELGGGNLEGDARSVVVELPASETEQLLRQVPEVYRTQVNDVLLAAFHQAMAPWVGSRRVLVDLEGHGREEIFDDADVTRTVGWFTAIYPVVLDLDPAAGPGQAIQAIKEQLRAVPSRGLGHGLLRWLRQGEAVATRLAAMPAAEVSFNYLGQFDQALPASSPFAFARESLGPGYSPRAKRAYLLDVQSSVRGGRLRVRITYGEHLFRRETIEALAERFLAAIRALVAHCLSPEAGGYTPSDFQKADLSQEDIGDLLDQLPDEE
jgi:amino acid adenylation domain-containing protein/non-ribosomal peptide synthase protein (TIGR01720 family)